jgi:CheY-like chemotaxis protein
MITDTSVILLVEDDPLDVKLIQRAFKEIEVTNPIQVTGDGEQALAQMRDSEALLPQLILLDLNMPRMNGFELLEILKQDHELKKIPVVVLTSSDEQRDIITSFTLGAAGYMVKPIDYLQLVEVIKTINHYWRLSKTPPVRH